MKTEEDNIVRGPAHYESVLSPVGQWAVIIILVTVLLLGGVAIAKYILTDGYSESDKRMDRLEQGYSSLSTRVDSMLFLIGRNQAGIDQLKKAH